MTMTPAYASPLHAAPLQQATATCNGTIYRDDNGNGALNANEPFVSAGRIEIYDLNETLLGQAITDGQGNWSISGLPAATQIRVQVKTPLPGGLIEGPIGSDSEGFVVFTDTSACSDMTFGALLVSVCSNLCLEVGNRVWFDENPDGLQNANEQGIEGVTVSIYDDNDQLVAQKVTDANGLYLFTCLDGLEPETNYQIRLDNGADYANGGPLFETFLTNAFQGTDPQIDSVGTLSNNIPTYGFTTGQPGQSFHQIDFGFTPPATIGDTVWFDVNGNQVQDTYDLAYSTAFDDLQGIDFSSHITVPQTGIAEVGIPNVTINLYGAGADNVVGTPDDVLLDTQITDALGQYRFRPLQPGLPYRVELDDSTLPGVMTASYDEDGAGDHNIVVSALTAGQQHMTADFGYTGGVDLAIDKQPDFPDWRPRSTIEWTVVVTNYGALPAPRVVVADVMGETYGGGGKADFAGSSDDAGKGGSGLDIILARIFELYWSYDPVNGNFNLAPNVNSQTDAEALIDTWLTNNVSVSGGPDWSCTWDYVLQFPNGLVPPQEAQTIQDLQLHYFCELISGDLMPGAAAPPIVFSIGNEFNSMNHEPETLNIANNIFLGYWDYHPEYELGNKETNYAITESFYGAEPFGNHANEDQATIDDIGDLQWDKTLLNSASAPFDVGEDMLWEITVTNVGSNPWYKGIYLSDYTGYGYITVAPGAPWTCDPLKPAPEKDNNVQCYHAALAGGLAPGASVTAQVTTRMLSSPGNTIPITHPENLFNRASASYSTAYDDDTNNNIDTVPYTIATTAWTVSKGSPVEVNGQLEWTINHNVTAAMIPAGQVFIIEERLQPTMPLLSVVSSGWQCELKDPTATNFTQNYQICWYDPVANPGTIPSLVIRTAFVDGLSNTACPGRGVRYGPQDWSFGVNTGPCESSPVFGGVPIAPTDMAITKVHDAATEPWARGSNGTFTLNISELGVGPDRPVVEDVLQIGMTLVDIRNASGQSLIDSSGNPVSGTGWNCTSNLTPNQMQIFQPHTIGFYGGLFRCIGDNTLSNSSDVLYVDVQVTSDAGDFVHNDAAIEGLTRAEPRKTTNNPPLWVSGDLGTVDNYDNDEVPVPSPDLKIEKSHVAPVFAGVAFDFTILVTNNSDFSGIPAGDPVPAPAPLPLPVHITDTYPLGLDYLGFTGTGWSCTSDGATPPTVSCSYGTSGQTLTAGTSAPPLLLQSIAPGTSVAQTTNAAAVWTDQSPIVFYSQTPDAITDTLTINIPFVEATKTSSQPQVLVGDPGANTFDFVLTIDNSQGNGAALAPVKITDNIPPEFNINSINPGADWNCSASSGQLVDCIYIPGNFPQGGNSAVTVNVTVDGAAAAGQVLNTMNASHGGIQSVPSELTSTRAINVLRYANVTVGKSRDIAQPNPGDTINYTVVITNAGPSGAQDVQILDYVPYGAFYIDNQGSNPAWSCSSDGGSPELVTCDLSGDLAVGNAPTLILRMGLTGDAFPGVTNFITVQSSTASTPDFTGQTYALDEYMAVTGCIGDYVWLDSGEDGVEEGMAAGPDGIMDTLDDVFNLIGPGLDGIMSTPDDITHGFNNVTLSLAWAGPDGNFGTADDVNMGTTQTDASGYYAFEFIPAGNYTVTVDTSTGVLTADGSPLASYNPTYDFDSGTTNPDNTTALVVGDTPANWIRQDIDFGYFNIEPAEFGDRVWLEDDGDGLASTGTITPIAGMTITATDGVNIFTAVTDAAGYYSFTVPSGTYTVTYGLVPAGYGPVGPSAIPGGSSESGNAGTYMQSGDPDQSHAQNSTVTVGSGQANWHMDFAFMPEPAQFGDRVWLEDDGDGDASTGTVTAIAGMTITATNGAATYTVVTDANGYYSFTVPAGTYNVTYGPVPIGYGPAIPSAILGGNSESGNAGTYMEGGNPDQSHAQNSTVTVGAGETNWHMDFAFMPEPAQFGDRVWLEDDGDGDAATGTVTAIAGMTITATNGAATYTAVTDAAGYYSFTVPAGTYNVTYGPVPAGYGLVIPSATPGGNSESGNAGTYMEGGDPDQSHVQNSTVTVGAGETNWHMDFAFMPEPAQFGDRVWLEDDGDGDASTGTVTAIAGMTITATNGAATYTAVTDANGYYSFTVPAGTYNVAYGPVPAGYGPTVPSAIPGGNSESGNAGTYMEGGDPDQSHAQNSTVTVAVGEANWHMDFAFMPEPAQIGDRVWLEDDGDGDASTGVVTAIAGMTITATNGVDVYTAVTDAAGYYSFTVPADTYTISYGPVPAAYGPVIPSATPGGNSESGNAGTYMEGGDPDQSHEQDTTVTVAAGETNWHVDFAFMPEPAQFGDRVWLENDGDGDASTGFMSAIAGMTITATDGANVFTAVTDAAGYYSFTVPAGTYDVTYGPVPAGYGPVLPSLTPGGNSESGNAGTYMEGGDPDQSHAQGTTVTVAVAEENWHVDFAFSPEVSLGSTLFYDDDNSGTQNGTEAGIPNIVVELYTATGTFVMSDTTDSNGDYFFGGLLPSNYQVVVPNPPADAPMSSTVTNTNDDPTDLDDNGSQLGGAGTAVSSPIINLTAGQEPTGESGTGGSQDNAADSNGNMTVDFGFISYDYGDAPNSYGTLDANSGAKHLMDGVTFLGNVVDPEGDGMPSMNADGDDVSVGDDEDGVTFLTPIMVGQPFTIAVVASAPGYLNTWIDFDGSGTFDAGEQIFSDQLLSAGTNTLTFNAPATVDDDNLYSRFRFSANAGEVTGPTGAAPTGEVEDYVLVALGDTVWHDNGAGGSVANNGVHDGTEAGIPNVVVELIDGNNNVVATTTTDSNGEYLFTGLVPGDYTVHLPASNFAAGAPLEDHFSSSGTATDPDDDQDMDDNGVGDGYSDPMSDGISSLSITLAPDDEPTNDGDGGHSNRTVDFGLVQYDKGDLPDTTVGAGPGDYETLTTNGHNGAMHVIVPDVFLGAGVDGEADGQPSTDANGDNDADTNDEDGVLFTSILIPGQNATVDVTANVDGYLNAWIDFNGDGDFTDPGEQIATDTALTAGVNNLTYPVPAGTLASDLYTRFRFTSDDPASAMDANGAWDNGEVEDYVLSGLSLGNQVWHDLDNNGIRDTNEPALDGVLVNLIDPATGNVLMTDTTANGGYYIFDKLMGAADHIAVTGDYIVEIDASNFAAGGPLAGMYNSTPTEANPNDDLDLNDNGINAPQGSAIQSGIVTLTEGGETIYESWFGPAGHGNAADESSNLTVDFGFYLPVTVGDTVFYDNDQDGLQAGVATEPGVPGIDVTLYDSVTGQPVLDAAGNPMTMTTDSNGEYLFEELPPGRYHVEFDLADLPLNYVVTAPHVGNNISIDSNANPSTGTTDSTPFLYSGAEDLTLDMGIMLLENVRVGDRVWFDDNKDGIQDSGEMGVPNITVALYDNATGAPVTDAAGNPMTTVTDAGGNYLFDDLPPGDYYVEFDLSTLPQNYLVTTQDAGGNDDEDSDADPATGVTAPTGPLNSGEQDLSLDMGIYRLDNVEVGDHVWYDDNRDGIQDAGEAGVENVVVMLYDTATSMPVLDATGNPMSTMTDVNGEYLFTDLPPGDYYVMFDLSSLPQNYTPTQQDAGSDDAVDSDADATTGATAPTGMLNSNESDLTLDMGIHRLDNVEVGDRVWFDNDKDGVQDAGELGVPGVGVALYDATTGAPVTDGAGNPLTTVTDANGNYLFDKLPPGDYYVVFNLNTLPPNQVLTAPNVGGDTTDSDADPLTGQTPSTGMLNSGDSDLTLDMGIHSQDNVVVGDYVWYDDNRDGIQDAGEAGVPNVLAVLHDTATGQPVTDQFGVPLIDLTDANGLYLFENLAPGDYFVEFQLSTLPTDYVVTQPNQGSDDTLDSDADQSTGRTGTTGYLQANQEDRTLDMGIYRPEAVRVGDRVWLDNDRDGVQDGNEVGVSGVTVTLVDSAGVPVTQDRDGNAIMPQVTDANGNYLFDNLEDGDYAVVFALSTLPTNHVVTPVDQGNDDLLDSDADPTTGATPSTGKLADGDEDLSLDMGIYPLSEVMVGDTVWYDNNADGIQNASEPGVAGVVVHLFNADGTSVTDMAGNPVGSTATDANGNYLFDNLPEGNYYVGFDPNSLPAGHLPTTPNAGSDDSVDSDAVLDPASLLLQTSTTGKLADGDADLTLDLGIFQPASLGDRVWEDLNSDGVQDAGEPGIAGVKVKLYNADGTPAVDLSGNPMTTTTDANGNYSFDKLMPGDYYVEFAAPAGYDPSPQDSGGDDSKDSDADPITGKTVVTTLTAGENDTTWDAGFYRPVPVVTPTPEPTSTPGPTPTPEPTLPPTETPTTEPTLPVTPTPVTPTPVTPTPVTPTPVTPTPTPTPVTTPMPDEVRIGDRVWYDNDGNGIQDADEPGVPKVTVRLYKADGTLVTDLAGAVVQPLETDENGFYLFDNLPEGNYYVEFDLNNIPAGYLITEPNVGGDDGADSDADPATGHTDTTGFLTAGSQDLTLDMGLVAPVTVGDRVWYDYDGDGLQGSPEDEPGVEGVTVVLLKSDGTAAVDMAGRSVMPTETDANGNYLFGKLPPGDYQVMFELGTLPRNHLVTKQNANSDQPSAISHQQDSDADPITGLTEPTGMLLANEADLTLDLGILPVPPVIIGDRVWEDTNSDGIQDTHELGVEGVTVTLFNTDGLPVVDLDDNPVLPIDTDASGNYLFDKLPEGDYYVQFDLTDLPDGYEVTAQDAGSDDDADSDGDPVNGMTAPTGFLTAGSQDLSLDLGIAPEKPVRVGNFVWFDDNSNGIQDADEAGVEKVKVTLFNASPGAGSGTSVTDMDGNTVASTHTDSNGAYLFENLVPGDYYVQFDLGSLPPNYVVTVPNAGSDETDSDASPSSGETDSTGFIASGGEDLTLDMGITLIDPDVRIGDRVWLDENQNGLQDAGEPGVEGVVVILYETQSGDELEKTVTDADGNYLFDALFPGDYRVGFVLSSIPENHGVVKPDAGDDALDSDGDPETGLTPPTGILFTGEEDLTLDMGLYQIDAVAVGDRAWYDLDGNGLQNDDEPGVEGVVVTLYDTTTGQPVPGVPEQKTDSNGNYLFTDLAAGDYFIVFDMETLPDGYGLTESNVGDDTLDSDVNSAKGQTSPTGPLSGNDSDLTLDMGIVQLPDIMIGDRVWFDDNGDGIQDPTEDGVPGVSVNLYDAITGEPVADDAGDPLMQVTDSNGEYLFTQLPPGKYYVQFALDTIPDDHLVSPSDQEASDTADSDAGPDGTTPPTDVLTYGDIDRTLDMGIYKPIQIGDRVWFDDGNGIQDSPQDGLEEKGVPEVVVVLYDVETGEAIEKTTTDSDGNYLFENLVPGNYRVQFDLESLPEGYLVTHPDRGGDDGADSDADQESGETPETGFLSSGESDLSLDMGIVLPIEIGDRVWSDENRDGIQDDGELGVEGVAVVLYDADDNPIAKSETDAQGNYLFADLLPGDYSIGFELSTLPEDHVVSEPNVEDDSLDSDANPDDGRTPNTGFLPSGSKDLDLDMGIHIPLEELVRVGGQVWEDTDLDGVTDPEEKLWPEITVILYDLDDPETPIAQAVTDENGNYLFEELPPGKYFTTLEPTSLPEDALPPAYYSAGLLDDLRSNSGKLEQGDEALELDMALRFLASLSGLAWLDANGDGIRTPDEKIISNVLVELYDATGEKVGTQETDADGAYLFDDLIPGEYRVLCPGDKTYKLSPPLQGDDDSRDSDINPETNETDAKFVGSGQHLPHIDLGLFTRASLSNVIWADANGDGVQDVDEAGIAGITVFLNNAAGEVIAETVTDKSGRYSFADLGPGQYYATFLAPPNMVLVTDVENGAMVRGPLISIDENSSGISNVSAIDIGFAQPAALGNYVWLDINKDGVADPDEAGIADAIVRLLDPTGNLLEVTTTDSDGRFEFLVAPGEYQIEFLPKEGMEFTKLNQGDDSKDSDADTETGRTALITIDPGETDFTHFAGMIVSPTAIQLMSLTATETTAGVRVQWVTGSEIDTFGFQILRSHSGDLESAVTVTDGMVLARGDDGVYEFIDTTARAGQVYSYWLAEVQSDQTVYHYGPAQVVVGGLRSTNNGFMLFLPLIEK